MQYDSSMLRQRIATIRWCCLASISLAVIVNGFADQGIAQEQFIIFEDFDDGSVRDGSPLSWFGGADQLVAGDLHITSNQGVVTWRPRMNSELDGFSIRARGRLDVGNILGLGRSSWMLLNSGNVLAVGTGNETHEQVRLDFNPIDQDVILQLDTFDGDFRAWAWLPGDPPPTEEVMVSAPIRPIDGPPMIWANNIAGPTSAFFRWVNISNEHLPVTSPWDYLTLPGDYDGNSVLEAVDIDVLSAEVRAGDSTDFRFHDLNGDQLINTDDRTHWIVELKKTWLGDANLDGEFNSNDFVQVLQAGEFEDELIGNSSWSTGDWNGNAEFDSSDFVFAFQDGGYELGPRAGVIFVPEPTSFAIIVAGLIAITNFLRIPHERWNKSRRLDLDVARFSVELRDS